MIINYNSTAVNTYNSLAKNTANTTKSIQQLSSGKRINTAADDPAGSAITTLMQNQINGLSQAKLNASTGNDLLQTAADALGNIKNILAEMKTKATQAASDNNTAADRAKLQSQVDSLAQGISDITNTTEFNTQNLLAGGLSDTFHVGANSNQNIKVSISAMDAASLGVASFLTAATNVNSSETGLSMASIGRGLDAASGYAVTVNSVAATIGDKVTTILKKVNANTISLGVTDTSKFTGTVDTNYQVKVSSVGTIAATNATTGTTSTVKSIAYSTDGGASWKTVNGDFTKGVSVDGVTLKLADSTSSAATNRAYTEGDQFNFSIKSSYDTLQLTGKGVAATVAAPRTTFAIDDSKTASAAITDSSKITADATYHVNIKAVDAAGAITSAEYVKNGDTAHAVAITGADLAAGKTIDGVTLKLSAGDATHKYTAGDSADFTVKAAGSGTNIGASVDVHQGDSTVTIGDGSTGRTVGLQFDYNNINAMATAASLNGTATDALRFSAKHIDSKAAVVVNGKVTTNAQVAAGIDISTQASANAAIKTIDDATSKVSDQYAQIGAYQDRLSYTQDNLTSENTNLSSAQSNIQNVDIAQATTEYQKNNILQQAATSMLAKANQLPQTALQLLQG